MTGGRGLPHWEQNPAPTEFCIPQEGQNRAAWGLDEVGSAVDGPAVLGTEGGSWVDIPEGGRLAPGAGVVGDAGGWLGDACPVAPGGAAGALAARRVRTEPNSK